METYDVGFTMEDPREIERKAQEEWEAGQAREAGDLERFAVGRDASQSEDFWGALDASDPLMLAVGKAAGAAGGLATPGEIKKAESAQELLESIKMDAVRSARSSLGGATGALNRRTEALVGAGVDIPTVFPDLNVAQERALTGSGHPVSSRYRDKMVSAAKGAKVPGMKITGRMNAPLNWAMNKVLTEGSGGVDRPNAQVLDEMVERFIRDKTQERAFWSAEKRRRRALVTAATADHAAIKASRLANIGKGALRGAGKVVGLAGGVAGAAFMPSIIALKELGATGELDKTLGHMSYNLMGRPLNENDLSPETYDELVSDIGLAEKLFDVGVLSSDLHDALLLTAVRKHLLKEAQIGATGEPSELIGHRRHGYE